MQELTLDAVRSKAKALAETLRDRLGDRLLCAALYGSAARGDFKPASSDVNLVLVLSEASLAVLASCAPPLQAARGELRCSPLLLTRDELRQAADVFPLKLLEIRRSYRLLLGDDLLAGLTIAFHDLRLACEHELRNIALKLRHAFVLGSPDAARLAAALHQFAPQLLAVLRVLAEHEGAATPSQETVCAWGARRFGLSEAPLRATLALVPASPPPWPELQRTFSAFLAVVEAVSRAVDAMAPASERAV
jgi:predicted nucleotidyltransferase